MFSICISSKNM